MSRLRPQRPSPWLMTSTVASSFTQYQAALRALKESSGISPEDALAILCSRDALQIAIADNPEQMATQLQQIQTLDNFP